MEQFSNSSTSSSDEDSQNMARNNANRGRKPAHVEFDLSAAMDQEQLTQLLSLIETIIESMQNDIVRNFETLPMQPQAQQGIAPPEVVINIIPNPRGDKTSQTFKDLPSSSQTNQSTTAGTRKNEASKLPYFVPESPEQLLKLWQKDPTTVLRESASEIMKDQLGHFMKWRAIVTKRFSDIVIKGTGTSGEVAKQGQQSPFGNAAQSNNVNAAGVPQNPSNVPSESEKASNMQLQHLNPAFVTPLKSCSRTKRALFLHCVLLILLGSEQYGAYSRKLLLKLAISLDAPVWVLSNDEIRFASASSKIIRGIPIEEILQRRAEESKPGMRRFRSQMNSATLGGENAGKLAAPLAASRIGTVFAGYGLQPAATTALIGPLNESTVAIGTLFGLYGARQGSKSMEAHGKDVLDLAMIPLHLPYNPGLIDPKDVPTDSRKLRVTIAVSGLLTSNQDLRESWNFLGQQNEVYVMRWELEALSKMGTSFEILGKSLAWDEAKKEITSRTVFDRLRDSLWPYSLMKISKIIDQPWTIGMTRAEKAGQVLADTIMNKMYGERPISLAGYSFGARVIYVCMMILAEKRAFGLLENVILIGAPCPADIPCWVSLRSVCVGRLINVFSPQDYLLGFLHRSSAWMYGVAGLQEIMGVPNVENFNASHFAASHLRYHYLVGTILKKLNWEDVDYQQVALQQDKLNELIDIEDNFVASRIQQRDAKAKQAAQEEAKEQPEEQGLQDVTNKFRRTNLGPERRR